MAITYEEFGARYNLMYEEWEEDGLGILVGAAVEIENEQYFLMAAKEYVKPHTQISVNLKAGVKDPRKAVELFVNELRIGDKEVTEIGSYCFSSRWQIVRDTKEDGCVVISNFEKEADARRALDYYLPKCTDKCFLRFIN